jgi:N-acetylglucosaminyldiphosphoundecaprenol N-acetyl-beta-D-mannosaminyltransferase
MKSIKLFGAQMHTGSMNESVDLIIERIKKGIFTQHVVVNVAKIVKMQKDSVLASSISACDLINIDGMGVVWGARFLGKDVPERVAGVDLFHNLLEKSAEEKLPVYLLGATHQVVSKTTSNVQELYPELEVSGYHHGYFWDDEEAVVESIKASGAKLLFVAITSPKKENFINKWQDKLGVDFVMGVGGTFDVVAGEVKRAPVWMQNIGMEWFYRMMQEPTRMVGRYVPTNARFVAMLFKGKFSSNYRENGRIKNA